MRVASRQPLPAFAPCPAATVSMASVSVSAAAAAPPTPVAAPRRKQRVPAAPPAAAPSAPAALPLTFSYPETRAPALQKSPLSSPTKPLSVNRHYVFVYGTLKRGFANSYLMERATYVGDFRTQTRFPLVVGGKYNSPYLLDMPCIGSRVKGELYMVDDAVLSDLDHLENVGVNYSRSVTAVTCCADRSFSLHAFVYLKQNNLRELSKKQYLDDYQCRLYVPRHLRAALEERK